MSPASTRLSPALRILLPLGWVAAAVICLAPLWGNPYQVTVAVNICVTLILTLSLNLVVGFSGQFHLSHAAFFGVGAYTAGVLAAKLGVSPWLCLPAAIAVVSLLAAAVGIPSTRLKGLYLAVATLAFSLFVEVLVNQGGAVTGGGYGLQNIPRLTLGSLTLTGHAFYPVALTALLATILILRNLMRSKFGREVIATRDHADGAQASGINPALVRLVVLVIAAGLAALAGWVHAFYHGALNPTLLAPELTFVWYFMVLVGGIGNTPGVILGTLVLSVVPEFMGFATGQTVFGIGVLMVMVTLFAPRGLGGLATDLLARARFRVFRRAETG